MNDLKQHDIDEAAFNSIASKIGTKAAKYGTAAKQMATGAAQSAKSLITSPKTRAAIRTVAAPLVGANREDFVRNHPLGVAYHVAKDVLNGGKTYKTGVKHMDKQIDKKAELIAKILAKHGKKNDPIQEAAVAALRVAAPKVAKPAIQLATAPKPYTAPVGQAAANAPKPGVGSLASKAVRAGGVGVAAATYSPDLNAGEDQMIKQNLNKYGVYDPKMKQAPARKPQEVPQTEPSTQPAPKPSIQPAPKPYTAPDTKPANEPEIAPGKKPETTPSKEPEATPDKKPGSSLLPALGVVAGTAIAAQTLRKLGTKTKEDDREEDLPRRRYYGGGKDLRTKVTGTGIRESKCMCSKCRRKKGQ